MSPMEARVITAALKRVQETHRKAVKQSVIFAKNNTLANAQRADKHEFEFMSACENTIQFIAKNREV
jgi:hypothetical protein